jgi:hypothetical protein
LLTWQSDYRETITTLTDQLADTLRLLGYAASDFRAVTQGSEQFAKTAERVGRTMDGIEAGEARLVELARGLSKLTEQASGRIPFIESRLYELTTQMTNAVQSTQASLTAALMESAADTRHALTASQQSFAEIARAGAEQMRENQAAIAASLTQNASTMSAALSGTQQSLLAAIAGFDQQTAALIGRTRECVAQLDRAVTDDLTRVIEGLARQLTDHVEAAGATIAGKPAKPRLQIVADAAGDD